VKYWETIADNLSKTGWSWGCVSALDAQGRTIWIVDAHGDGKRFIVRADEKLTAFLELESAILQLRKRQSRCTSISVVCRFSHFADYGERAD
jgi:hypothetical protein